MRIAALLLFALSALAQASQAAEELIASAT